MLSKKVVCAVVVLNELYCSNLDKKSGFKMIRRTLLAKNCGHDSKTFRRVMQELYTSNYIGTDNSLVLLTCDPTIVTIYDLYKSLHGGIPLGEDMKQSENIYLATSHKYKNLTQFEKDLEEISKKYFKKKTVASMINEKQLPNNHKIEK